MAVKTDMTSSQIANLTWLNQQGKGYEKIDLKRLNALLDYYGLKALENINKKIVEKQVVNSGDMAKTMNYKITSDNNVDTISIYIKDYYRFVDKGVKGVTFDKNAPQSPYKFKTLTGMSKTGRESIKSLITSGRAKVRAITKSVSKTESKGLSHKGKKSLIDRQTDTLIYLIKKHGIKATNFFKEGFEETFKTLEQDLAEALSTDISINIVTI
jgi:hypothetical protein